MELHGRYVAALDGRAEGNAVLTDRRRVGHHRSRVGVREVDLRRIADAGHQPRRPRHFDGVPAYVGHFQGAWDLGLGTWKPQVEAPSVEGAESCDVGSLLTSFEQPLEADTDSQQRN